MDENEKAKKVEEVLNLFKGFTCKDIQKILMKALDESLKICVHPGDNK